MSREPVTIDLGTFRYDPDGAAAERVTGAPRWRPRHGSVRFGGLALVAALAASLAGAVGPAPAPLERLWSMPVDAAAARGLAGFVVDDERLYLGTVDISGSRPVGTGSLTAYRLADGRIEWQRPLETFQQPEVRLVGAMVLASTGGGLDAPGVTTAYDPVTGEQQWARPEPVSYRSTGDLLLMRGETTLPDSPDESHTATQELIAADPQTGLDTGGRFVVAGTARLAGWDMPDGGTDVLVLAYDGTLTRYDLAAGEAAATVETPHVEREEKVGQNSLSVDNGLLLVGARGGDEPPVLSAYDPMSLTHRWDLPRGLWATPCGPLLCVAIGEDAGAPPDSVEALDPATGHTRWTVSCPDDVAAVRCSASPQVQQLEPDERLWVTQRVFDVGPSGEFGDERVTSWVTDARTGRSLTGTVGWRLARQLSSSELLLARQEPVPRGEPTGGRERRPMRTWWARADIDLTEVRVLGVTEAHFCRLRPPYLLCETQGEELTAWRLNA